MSQADGYALEARVEALVESLAAAFPSNFSFARQPRLELQSGDIVVPDFSVVLDLPHERSEYLVECQQRKRSSNSLLHKIQHVRAKSRFQTFAFVYGTRITTARRRSLESEGVLVYSYSEFAHAFLGYMRQTLRSLREPSSEVRAAEFDRLLAEVPHFRHDDYARRRRSVGAGSAPQPIGYPGNVEVANQVVFNRHFLDLGGRVRPEDCGAYSEDVRRMDEGFNSLLRELGHYFGPGVSIHFSPVTSLDIAAYSMRGGYGQYFIGLSIGSLVRFTNAFSYLMSIPDVLPDIGKPGEEQGSAFNLEAVLLGAFWNSTPAVRGRVRTYAARLMVDFALDAMFSHELSHILDGHLEYGAKLGSSRIAQVGENPSWVSLTAEALADRHAAVMLLQFPSRGLVDRRTLTYEMPDQEPYDDYSLWMLWSFAMVMLYSSLDGIEPGGRQTHGHPAVRIRTMFRAAEEVIASQPREKRAACEAGFYAGQAAAAHAVELNSHTGALLGFQELQGNELDEAVGRLDSRLGGDEAKELEALSLWKFFRFPR